MWQTVSVAEYPPQHVLSSTEFEAFPIVDGLASIHDLDKESWLVHLLLT